MALARSMFAPLLRLLGLLGLLALGYPLQLHAGGVRPAPAPAPNRYSSDHGYTGDDTVPVAPTALLVEYRPSPVIGVLSSQPRFSWTLSSAKRDVSAAAYQKRRQRSHANGLGQRQGGEQCLQPGRLRHRARARHTVHVEGAMVESWRRRRRQWWHWP